MASEDEAGVERKERSSKADLRKRGQERAGEPDSFDA